jgi:hypothetical protein
VARPFGGFLGKAMSGDVRVIRRRRGVARAASISMGGYGEICRESDWTQGFIRVVSRVAQKYGCCQAGVVYPCTTASVTPLSFFFNVFVIPA